MVTEPSPICGFARDYAASGISRFHMPGHKGVILHGLEPLDLTEIKGADFLFEADGIIYESERRTSRAFGSRTTCYSAEGSSLSIKAALCVIRQYLGREIRVASPRNCHRAFVNACALLDIDPVWLWADSERTMLCECAVSPAEVERCLEREHIDAVYITSPDYLGNIADICGIAEVCHRHGAFLVCDNAHGAYLKFAGEGLHPLELGADIVCDSAHKTLPVYTGGAYLHISNGAPAEFDALAKPAMALFGSTSPSYLIMQSLDRCAELLCGELPAMIRACCEKTARLKALMAERGIPDLSAEPMKITAAAGRIGYSGEELAELMRGGKMECEYSDPSAVVLMTSPYNSEEDFLRLERFFGTLDLREPLPETESGLLRLRPERVVSVREAVLSAAKRIPVDEAEGRVAARTAMSCQPSVAVVMAGERITAGIIKILKSYSIFEADVL